MEGRTRCLGRVHAYTGTQAIAEVSPDRADWRSLGRFSRTDRDRCGRQFDTILMLRRIRHQPGQRKGKRRSRNLIQPRRVVVCLFIAMAFCVVSRPPVRQTPAESSSPACPPPACPAYRQAGGRQVALAHSLIQIIYSCPSTKLRIYDDELQHPAPSQARLRRPARVLRRRAPPGSPSPSSLS